MSIHTDKQIADALKNVQGRAGSIVDACRDVGISIPTYYAWRRLYGGMSTAEIKQARAARQRDREQHVGVCSATDLSKWQKRMGFTYVQAASALGVANSSYTEMARGRTRIDLRTALACAAIEKNIKPIGVSK